MRSLYTSDRKLGIKRLKNEALTSQIVKIPIWDKYTLRDGGPKRVDNSELIMLYNKGSYQSIFERHNIYVFQVSPQVSFETNKDNIRMVKDLKLPRGKQLEDI